MSEKYKMLFEIAKSEYQKESDHLRQLSENAQRMVSLTGFLFTIFSVLLWRIVIEQKFSKSLESVLYTLSFCISFLILLIIGGLLRAILGNQPQTIDFSSQWQKMFQQETDFEYSCAWVCEQYMTATEQARAYIKKQFKILRFSAMLIQGAYVLLGLLVVLTFWGD
nr:hypothetical protein [uncultured Moraxella sp.]